MSIVPPPIAQTTQSGTEARLKAMIANFTPEWQAHAEDPGAALVKIFSFLTQETLDRLNRAPERNQLAFLDMLGIRLLPQTPANVFLLFRVAEGLPGPILAPAGTLATAASEDGEVPFETDEALSANAGAISGFFAIDPANDAVYRPPQGFLEKASVGSPWPGYVTAAFSSAGSTALQLRLVDGVEPGDTLRVDGKDYVVAGKQGLIVQLMQPLAEDVNVDAPVQKRTTFELFNGVNLQEHVLYVAHADCFNLKEAAVITLTVKAAAAGDPAEVVWEYFTEDPLTKASYWARFVTGRDETAGLSRGGRIELIKPKGEIKAVEVDGQSSRWIRARRVPPVGRLERLSKLDSLGINVAAENAIAGEVGFYNESPLTVTAPPFNPLGFEPQLFDRFQLASSEAFSKHGAEVKLHFELDQSRLLGAPSAAVGADHVPRVFARGVLTRLVEVLFPSLKFEESKKPPAPPAPGAIPAVVSAGSNLMAVAVRCQDDAVHLFRSSSLGAQDGWTVFDAPDGSKVALDPAAVLAFGEWQVFAVADGKLYRKSVPPGGGAGSAWSALTDPGFKPASAPAAAVDGAGRPVIFVFDDQNQLWLVQWSAGSWEDQVGTAPPIGDEYQCESAALSHPFAVNSVLGGPEPAVFYRNKAGEIVGVLSSGGVQNFELPGGKKAVADPSCIRHKEDVQPEVFLIFAASGDDGKLHAKAVPQDLSLTGDWEERSNPQPVAGRPFAVSLFETQYQVFAASGQGSMMRLFARTETGFLRAGPNELLLLDDDAVAGTERYVKLEDSHVPHKLDNNFPHNRVAVLETGLAAPIANAAPYRLLDLVQDNLVTDLGSGADHVDLSTAITNGATPNLWLSIETAPPKFVPIASVTGNDKVLNLPMGVTISLGLASGVDCKLFTSLQTGTTPEEAAKHILLDNSAPREPIAYKGADITIETSQGHVDQYDGDRQIAVLRDTVPAVAGDLYSFPEQWVQIQDPSLDDIDPTLSWEYWNGTGWVNLELKETNDRVTGLPLPKDGTQDLIRSGDVYFTVPPDLAPTEIAGQSNYWIRARLVGGNYGQVKFETKAVADGATTTFTAERKDFSRPPIVDGLTIKYEITSDERPQSLRTLNNLDFLDQTAANTTEGKSFEPFMRLDSDEKSLYMGFTNRLSSGSVLFALEKELPLDENRKLQWEAAFQNAFREIEASDQSGLITRTGVVQLNVPFEAERRQLLGRSAFWVRSRLLEQDWPESPELAGVFMNAAAARQLRTYLQEILGPSIGTPRQKFHFQNIPVFEEEIRVRTLLTREDRRRIEEEDGEDAVLSLRDESGRELDTWVLWQEVLEFSTSRFNSRHYRLDRASGELEFGDGRHGAIPPIGGDNIRAFRYRSGGGTTGNAGVGTIQSLATAVAGIDQVSNPLPAGGGSDEATRDEMLGLGSAELNHRGNALTATDYEWLARSISREVVKVRCVPNRDDAGLHNPGWVSVYIVARSKDRQPSPSLALCRAVRAGLLQRAPAALASAGRIFVGRPVYAAVTVRASVAAVSIARAAEAEAAVREALERFLHPLDGGPERTGWEFGQGLAISALYTEIENLGAVDHVDMLETIPSAGPDDYLELSPDQILASGVHEITMTVAEQELTSWR